MLEAIIFKLVSKGLRLDSEAVKSAKFERNYKGYYAFVLGGVRYEYPAREFTQAYWDYINGTGHALDLDL